MEPRRVPSDGPTDAEVLLIGEAPGYWETVTGQPFCERGKSGKELNRMLDRARLPRHTIRVTNLVKIQPPVVNGKQRPPSKEDIARDEPEIIEEILTVRPKWIGAVGRVAARWLLGSEVTMEAAHGLAFPLGARVRRLLRSQRDAVVPRAQRSRVGQSTADGVERKFRNALLASAGHAHPYLRSVESEVHARVSKLGDVQLPSDGRDSLDRNGSGPLRLRSGDDSGGVGEGAEDRWPSDQGWLENILVVPLYHPASGLHNSELAPLVWWDIQQLSLYVHGDLEPFSVVDEFPHPDYKEVIDADISRSIERSNTRLRPRTLAVDTEGVIGNVWGLSYASEAGRARVVRSVQSAALQESSRLVSGTGRVIFHNALYDVPILSELGIEVDWSRVEDTMLMLFCLRLLPLGLKPNGRRLAGVPMQSYDDVIRPAERRLALSYIKRAIDAKRCAVCGGTGKVAETRRVTDPNCDLCLGFGRISGAKKHTTKFCSCSKSTDACTACIDGGLWPARAGQPKYHWDTGVWSISTGWEIGRYLRKLQEDIEKGTFDDPDSDADEDSVETEGNERKPRTIRDRWKSWDDDVRGPVEELLGPMPEPTLDDIPSDDAIQYSARDADVTLRIYPKVSAMIDSMDLRRAYRIDLSVIPAAAEIQRNGMLVDCDKLLRLAKRLRRENDEILHQLRRACGRPINPASGDQVAALLFGERKLTYTDEDKVDFEPTFSFDLQSEKLTKSGRRASTDDKVLEGLKLKYSDREDIVSTVQLILDYRTRHKLVTTYAEKIPRLVDKEGRVHTRIRPTTAATFRWASGDPINLQNIPVRNKGGADLGRLIRECFIAPDGFVLSSADYEQVELRVLAALSGDGELLRAFIEGRDPHIIGAARAWSMSYDEIYEGRKAGVKKYADIRESSKNLNFGIVFGITPRGLQAQMELRGMKYTLEECADLIRMWIREVFPGIGDYIEETVSFARQHGYVRSLMGHIRYCPGVWSQINGIREAAEREAVNFRIQCTAAEVLKMGLADLWNKGKKTLDRVGTSLLMSIHDENLFQVRDTEVSRSVTATTVETFMMNPVDLPNGVKITTSMKFAVNWARLK